MIASAGPHSLISRMFSENGAPDRIRTYSFGLHAGLHGYVFAVALYERVGSAVDVDVTSLLAPRIFYSPRQFSAAKDCMG